MPLKSPIICNDNDDSYLSRTYNDIVSYFTEPSNGIHEWTNQYVNSQPNLNKGIQMNCKDLWGNDLSKSINRIGILFENCSYDKKITNSRYQIERSLIENQLMG